MLTTRLTQNCPIMKPRTSRALPVCSAFKPMQTCNLAKQAATMALSACVYLAGGNMAFAVPETSVAGSNAGFLSDQEIQLRRDELNFIRSFDGKVALKDHLGQYWDCKLDLKSPGTLLLREPTGLVHYLAFSSLSQVDLSDDEVVGAVAVSGWSNVLLISGRRTLQLFHALGSRGLAPPGTMPREL